MKRSRWSALSIFALVLAMGLVPRAASAQAYAQPTQSMYQPYYYSSSRPYQEARPMSAVSHLESFKYDPKLDPKNIPYVAPTAYDVPPETDGIISLATKSGLDIGLQISDYSYKEPSLSVKLEGTKFGITVSAFGNLGYGTYLGFDGRYALGNSDYTGSGTKSDNFENLLDARLLFGKDFVFTHYALSPYLGLGFRHFFSDDQGITSTGASGYRRANNLLYLPLGFKPRFRVTDGSRITANLEYDVVLKGLQMSMLSDADPGYPDIHNKQSGGYGIRADIMWEHESWSIGPFLNYWNIDQSDTVCASGTVYGICGFEPQNKTFEGGLQLKFHFF